MERRSRVRRPCFALPGILFAVLVVAAAPVAAPGVAAEPEAGATGKRLQEVERAIEEERKKKERLERQAVVLEADARRLGESLVAAARTLLENEREVGGLEEDVIRLQAEEHTARRALGDNRKRTIGVLMALQRLARHPPEAMIVQPVSPDDMVSWRHPVAGRGSGRRPPCRVPAPYPGHIGTGP